MRARPRRCRALTLISRATRSARSGQRSSAAFVRQGEELVITPVRPIRDHGRFVVRVAYTSGPREISPEDAGDLNKVVATAWFATPSGSITAAQPNGAHRIFPNNDVPSDPASYTFRAFTPAGSTFVANGELPASSPQGSHPVDLRAARADGHRAHPARVRGAHRPPARLRRGVRLRDVAPTGQIDQLEPALRRAPATTWTG